MDSFTAKNLGLVPAVSDLADVLAVSFDVKPIVPLLRTVGNQPLFGVVLGREVLMVHSEHLSYFDVKTKVDKPERVAQLEEHLHKLVHIAKDAEHAPLAKPLDELLTLKAGAQPFLDLEAELKLLGESVCQREAVYHLTEQEELDNDDPVEYLFRRYYGGQLHFALDLFKKISALYIQILVLKHPEMEHTWNTVKLMYLLRWAPGVMSRAAHARIHSPMLVPRVRQTKVLLQKNCYSTRHSLVLSLYQGNTVVFDRTNETRINTVSGDLTKDNLLETLTQVDRHDPVYTQALAHLKCDAEIKHVNEKMNYLFAHTFHFAGLAQAMIASSPLTVPTIAQTVVKGGDNDQQLVANLLHFMKMRVRRELNQLLTLNKIDHSLVCVHRPVFNYSDAAQVNQPDGVPAPPGAPSKFYNTVNLTTFFGQNPNGVSLTVGYVRAVNAELKQLVYSVFEKNLVVSQQPEISPTPLRIHGIWSAFNSTGVTELGNLCDVKNIPGSSKYGISNLDNHSAAKYTVKISLAAAVGSVMFKAALDKHVVLAISSVALLRTLYAVGKTQPAHVIKTLSDRPEFFLNKPQEFLHMADSVLQQYVENGMFFKFRSGQKEEGAPLNNFELLPDTLSINGKMFLPCRAMGKGSGVGVLKEGMEWISQMGIPKDASPLVKQTFERFANVYKMTHDCIVAAANNLSDVRFLKYMRPRFLSPVVTNTAVPTVRVLSKDYGTAAPVTLSVELSHFKGVRVATRHLLAMVGPFGSAYQYPIYLQKTSEIYDASFYSRHGQSEEECLPINVEKTESIVRVLLEESFDRTVRVSSLNTFNLDQAQYDMAVQILSSLGGQLIEDEPPIYAMIYYKPCERGQEEDDVAMMGGEDEETTSMMRGRVKRPYAATTTTMMGGPSKRLLAYDQEDLV
ncbi:protein ORF47 [Lake sturgeon herpesvirus]|nr:protein ORF47 [Lake sturgeon herpesvirus]